MKKLMFGLFLVFNNFIFAMETDKPAKPAPVRFHFSKEFRQKNLLYRHSFSIPSRIAMAEPAASPAPASSVSTQASTPAVKPAASSKVSGHIAVSRSASKVSSPEASSLPQTSSPITTKPEQQDKFQAKWKNINIVEIDEAGNMKITTGPFRKSRNMSVFELVSHLQSTN